MRPFVRATLVAALSLVLVPSASAQQPGPEYVTSDNVEYLGSIKDDVGMTTGARIVGNKLYVTSGKNLSIYDITDPAAPVREGMMKINISWENEEVPTNGKILGFGSDFYNASPEGGCLQALSVAGCTQFFDVRDPANIKELPAIPVANHTVECILDCQYFYGSSGSIIDARGALDGQGSGASGRLEGRHAGAGRQLLELPPHARALAGHHPHRLPAVRGALGAREGRRLAREPGGALHGRGGEVRALGALAA